MHGILKPSRVVSSPSAVISGQESFLLQTLEVALAITRAGGMMAPVTFFPEEEDPIRPYAIAPWAEEAVPAGVPSMLRTLRGDWFCSAFGENAEPYHEHALPPHGETANNHWSEIDRHESRRGGWLRLGMDLPLQGGMCQATTAVLAGQAVVYQRHDLRELTNPFNPGHHATLSFPQAQGSGRLSFSRFIHAQSYFEPTVRFDQGGFSWLRPNTYITDLTAARGMDGSTSDLTRFPARRGFEDVAIVCSDPTLDLAWSAVTFAEQGFVWFALRDPRKLASTLLWFSNGGRLFPPWSGRHVNVMGIEDVTSFFHVGIAASCRPNSLNERGVRTCLEPDVHGRLMITYIQGVARVRRPFDRVAAIDVAADEGSIILRADSGEVAKVRCDVEFLRTGTLQGLELP